MHGAQKGSFSRFRRRQTGSAMVEFAIVAPMLLALMFGVLQLGRALYAYHFVAASARWAARYAMVRGADCTGLSTACPASAGDIQTYVQNLAPGVIDTSAITATATWSPDHTPGSTVTVTVTYPLSLDIPFAPAAAINLTSTAQMVISQ